MTATCVTVESLLATRTRLLERIPALMDDAAAGFLVSVERESPDFNLIGLPQAANLPAIRRKLQNLAQRTAAKRESDYRQLADTLERLAAR